MKHRLYITVMAMLVSVTGLGVAQAATLEIVVENVKNHDGRIAVALYDKADGFPDNDEQALRRIFIPLKAGEPVLAIEDNLPSGQYAITVFHDDNLSGKLEKSVFGIPRKGYGFSNNIAPAMRSARFEEAVFLLPESGATLRIKLIYR